MLTVISWLWSQPGGRTAYTASHVNIWADMLGRNLSMPHRLACVTDMPAGIDPRIEIIPPPGDFEDVQIPTWADDRPQCFRRLSLFRPDAARIFGARFVSMDLDCAISGPLDPLFAGDDDFRICRGSAKNRPYNGSMLLMNAGARPQVFERFTAEGARLAGERYLGSDQAWIAQVLGNAEATWNAGEGVRFWGSVGADRDGIRVIFFLGSPKPWEIVRLGEDRWLAQHYRRAGGAGRCLVLGYAGSVWREAAAALETGPFQALIAAPEAARYWPGEVFAVAEVDEEADRLAVMHGFDEVVFCGRTEARP